MLLRSDSQKYFSSALQYILCSTFREIYVSVKVVLLHFMKTTAQMTAMFYVKLVTKLFLHISLFYLLHS